MIYIVVCVVLAGFGVTALYQAGESELAGDRPAQDVYMRWAIGAFLAIGLLLLRAAVIERWLA